jgi:hypothetical protein
MLKNKLTSPLTSVLGGYTYVGFLAAFLYYNDFYNDSTLFTWGVPVTFMGKTVTDEKTYYLILLMLFIHQLINNWVNDVAYPFILNNVQNKSCNTFIYPKSVTILLINLFDIYSQVDMILLISGMSSQITFFAVLLLANLVASTLINLQYLNEREKRIDRESVPLEEVLISDF